MQIPSCLFGGPPVRDNLIKLGESQIGFMNIFARPLFEAVTDILPAMHYAVEEILKNKQIWEDKIEAERERNKKHPNLKLGYLSPGFAPDPTPSPFSGGPSKPLLDVPTSPPAQPNSVNGLPKASAIEETARQGSSAPILANSRTSFTSAEKDSPDSSGTGLAGTRSLASHESQSQSQSQSQSRRESGDANLTAIFVTETANASDRPAKDGEHGSGHQAASPGNRKDTLTGRSLKRSEGEKKVVRPLTAPSSARRSQGKTTQPHTPFFFRAPRPFGTGPDFDSATNLFPAPNAPSQSHSEVDLTQAANGNYDDQKLHQWESNKISGDSTMSRSDTSRDGSRRSEWWRQVSSRRRTRDMRNGDADARGQQKEMMLDPTMSNTTSDTAAPTTPSPGRNSSRTGKLKSFFKWKPRHHTEDEKQLSSFGSSSHLRTPPTSDPGRSANSDD